MTKETEELLRRLREMTARLHAYQHAASVMYYDAATVAPRGGAEDRGKTLAVLSEEIYRLSTGEETGSLLKQLSERKAELGEADAREVSELLREYERTKKIPMEEYLAFTVLLNEADSVWHKAKVENDWPTFEPYMEKIVSAVIRQVGYTDPDKEPYNALLDQYERGLTTDDCDAFFSVLKAELVPLIHKIQEKGTQPDDSFMKCAYPIEKQRILSDRLMTLIGIDREYCAIGETEHPFTDGFSKKDVRITTHYHENDPMSSVFSVIHEGGHALYELNIADSLQGTTLATGVSMGIHESQSRFYENIIGRSRSFCKLMLPLMREIFPDQLSGVSEEAFYRAVNIAQPSLIRTEADELTYCLHIIIRYELERDLLSGKLAVHDLPAAWNEKVRSYLGIEVPDDRRGALQDSHWSGGAIGYFPSYALGSAYGAQILHAMRADLNPEAVIESGDLRPIADWLTGHIWQFGSLRDPKPLLEACVGAPFDPHYYTDYLKEKYTALYELN